MVLSELSCGGYFTEDGNVALPKYLVHLPGHNCFIVDIDFEEELSERVNGGNLYDDGNDVQYFDDSMREFELERSHVLLVY